MGKRVWRTLGRWGGEKTNESSAASGHTIPGRPKLGLYDPVTAHYIARVHFVMEVPNFRASQRNVIKKLTKTQQRKNPQVKRKLTLCLFYSSYLRNSFEFRTSTKKKRPRHEAAWKSKWSTCWLRLAQAWTRAEHQALAALAMQVPYKFIPSFIRTALSHIGFSGNASLEWSAVLSLCQGRQSVCSCLSPPRTGYRVIACQCVSRIQK